MITNRFRYKESAGYEKKEDRNPRTLAFVAKQLINANGLSHSAKLTSQIVTCLVACYGTLIFLSNVNDRTRHLLVIFPLQLSYAFALTL